METADIILLLVSLDFSAFDFRYEREMERTLQRNEARQAAVIQ